MSASEAASWAFQLRNVSVHFGQVTALEDIHLDVAAGERIGLVGPSGSGKTTLLRLLNGMQTPSRGDVRSLGRALHALSGADRRRLRSRIGWVPQQFSLAPSLRVFQNVVLGKLGQQNLWQSARTVLWPSKAVLVDVHRILERVGLEAKLFMRADTLSGGQQQRVAIARALYQQPELLLADEPVASVDPARADALLELLTTLAEEDGLTLCVSLHDLALARRYLPRLIGMRDGRLVKDAAAAAWTSADFEALYRLSDEEISAAS